MDRASAPPVKTIERVELLRPEQHTLSNACPVYWLHAGQQPVISLEVYFPAGGGFEHKNGSARLLAKCLLDGTKSHPKNQWLEALSGMGAVAEFSASPEHFKLSFYVRRAQFEALLSLVVEVLQEPALKGEDFEHHRQRLLQTRMVNLKRTSFRAQEAFKHGLFGKNHPYGQLLDEESLEALEPTDVRQHFEKHLAGKGFMVFLAGQCGAEELQALDQTLGKLTVNQTPEFTELPQKFPLNYAGQYSIPMDHAQQSSLRIGRRMFGKTHPHAAPFQVLNTALGGYFGSRLMAKLREEKGYTYGVASRYTPMISGAFWVLGSDVVKEKTPEALEDIYQEIERLTREPLSAEELETVRTYMQGSFLNSISTPFAHMARFKQLYFHGLSYDYYDELLESIKKVDAGELQELARKYLGPGKLMEVVAGAELK